MHNGAFTQQSGDTDAGAGKGCTKDSGRRAVKIYQSISIFLAEMSCCQILVHNQLRCSTYNHPTIYIHDAVPAIWGGLHNAHHGSFSGLGGPGPS